jgi:hypothetical protein
VKNLNGIQFSAIPSTGMTDPAFEAYDPSVEDDFKMVGAMWLHPETGNIEQITVEPSHQRRGIASEMYELAKIAHKHFPDKYPYPEHSPARTPEGNAWAQSTGDYVPPNTMPHHIR